MSLQTYDHITTLIELCLRSPVFMVSLWSELIFFFFFAPHTNESIDYIWQFQGCADVNWSWAYRSVCSHGPLLLFGLRLKCLHVCCSHTEVRGFACVSEWFGKSGPVLDTEIINPFGVGSSFTLSMILRAAYDCVRVWVKRKGNKRQQGESSGMRMS